MRVLSRSPRRRTPSRRDGRSRGSDRRRVEVAKLRVATWTEDGVFTPAVGVGRAVGEAAERLRAAGAEVVEVAPPNVEAMTRIYLGLVSADGLASVRNLIRDGAVDPQLARQTRLARIPRLARAALQPLLRLAGQRELGELLAWTGGRSASDYWRLVAEADDYRRRFWGELESLGRRPCRRGALARLRPAGAPAWNSVAPDPGGVAHLPRQPARRSRPAWRRWAWSPRTTSTRSWPHAAAARSTPATPAETPRAAPACRWRWRSWPRRGGTTWFWRSSPI